MRIVLVCALLLSAGLVWPVAFGGEEPKRYEVTRNLKKYPQDEPKTTLASVVKAIEDRRIDYLLAHLADPEFVDDRVKLYGGNFEELVKETTARMVDNPAVLKELRRFLKEGKWKTSDTTAEVSLDDVKSRRVYLRKIDKRWFLEQRQQPEKKDKEKE
jgi:hypothetical protein